MATNGLRIRFQGTKTYKKLLFNVTTPKKKSILSNCVILYNDYIVNPRIKPTNWAGGRRTMAMRTLFRAADAAIEKTEERVRGNEQLTRKLSSTLTFSHSRPKDSKKWWGYSPGAW